MRRLALAAAVAATLCLLLGRPGGAQEAAQSPDTSAIPAPASTADILALLDQEKPDPAKLAKLSADADAAIPANLKPAQRAEALFNRAKARVLVGRINDAITDGQEAIKFAKGENYDRIVSRYIQFVHRRFLETGDTKSAVPLMMDEMRNFEQRQRGRLFSLYQEMGRIYASADDMDDAQRLARNLHALLAESQAWTGGEPYRPIYRAEVFRADGYMQEFRNQFAAAEAIYRQGAQVQLEALDRYDDAVKLGGKDFPFREDFERGYDNFQLGEGRMKIQQGRAIEGEIDIRQALLRRLQRLGKYNEETAAAVSFLGAAMVGEGRYEDAEKLTRTTLDIYHTIGFRDDAPRVVFNLQQLAQILDARNKPAEARAIEEQVDRLVAGWEPARREAAVNELPRIKLLIGSGKAAEAVELASRKLAREKARSGDGSPSTAVVRGYLATALARAGRNAEALTAFTAAIPVLLESSRRQDADDSAAQGALADRNRYILEGYIDLSARDSTRGEVAAAEATIGLADRLRGSSVQRALAQASARSAGKDPALAGVARTEQDLRKQLSAATNDLANLLALPSDKRDAKVVNEAEAKLAKLRTSHAAAQSELARKFPAYANLIDPPPVGAADIRASLRDDEAVLSFYFGQNASFVWAVAKSGPVRFRALPITAAELDDKVARLRAALEPQASTISEIPPFDVALAHELYAALLEPVKDVWAPARNLIVVTNGALGFLPLGLLPTSATQPAPDPGTLFAEYRDVPWLARDHAVTVIPSVAALKALRGAAVADNQRQKLIGFGDPYFNEAQAAEAAKLPAPVAAKGGGAGGKSENGKPGSGKVSGAKTELAAAPAMDARGGPLEREHSLPAGDFTADLAKLPRLPDTADELRSIAAALGVDPAKALKLGKDANEKVVKASKLSSYRIVAFATHGLMADDIDGLNQPALALTAPKVAGIDGSGLLTMEDILALKLDADWVVLSACNTAAGSGAGAEAASGLGRAFFYAGARALLVTNWSVHSQSARDLIDDIFRRQAADQKLTRAQALRQAMMALIDGPGFKDDSGKTVFSYAHPLFWAPYSVIGDGG